MACRFGWRDAWLEVYSPHPCVPPTSRRDQRNATPCPLPVSEMFASIAVRRRQLELVPAKWLADPCTMALEEHMGLSRLAETARDRAFRLKQRKERQAAEAEAQQAKRARPTRW